MRAIQIGKNFYLPDIRRICRLVFNLNGILFYNTIPVIKIIVK